MIYLYAIIDASAAVPVCKGLDDALLGLARSSSVAGLYSTHDTLDPRPEPDALWRHEEVVEAAMDRGPALPVRFGTTFADEAALMRVLEREGDRMQRQLRRVSGCVELAVRVGLPERSEPIAQDGRGYLEARLAGRRTQQAVVRQVLAPLGDLATRTRSDQARGDGNVICASYLVAHDRVERFADEVKALADRAPELWMSCTGPWPPYSFVELEDAA